MTSTRSAVDRERGPAGHQTAPGAGLRNVAFEREFAEVGSVQRSSVVEEVGGLSRVAAVRPHPRVPRASQPRRRDPHQALDEVGHKRKLARRPRAWLEAAVLRRFRFVSRGFGVRALHHEYAGRAMAERSSRHSEAQDPGPQARCVCGEKVTIADAREVTLPNGRPGWEGRRPEVAPLCSRSAANRRAADAPRRGRVSSGRRGHASGVDASLAVDATVSRSRRWPGETPPWPLPRAAPPGSASVDSSRLLFGRRDRPTTALEAWHAAGPCRAGCARSPRPPTEAPIARHAASETIGGESTLMEVRAFLGLLKAAQRRCRTIKHL